ncbi:hypothetical protein Goari_017935, partial [Gossypium aridum]|nr:hypothetical protein [Gossypium aridum]
MEEELENLNIVDEEEQPIHNQEEEEENEDDFNLCLVGKVLTSSAVHFLLMRNILAELWHPMEGISITEIEEKRSMFRFFNKLDLKRVLDGIPWFFNRHLIIFHQLEKHEDSIQVPLVFSNFWVQIYNLPVGSMSKGMARQL